MSVFSDILISKVSEEVLPDWTVRTLKVEKVTELINTHTHTICVRKQLQDTPTMPLFTNFNYSNPRETLFTLFWNKIQKINVFLVEPPHGKVQRFGKFPPYYYTVSS